MYFAHRKLEFGTGRMLRESIDAIKPLFKAGDGSYFVHHVDNVGLTAEFYNYLKGTDIPLALAFLGEARRAYEIRDEEKLRKIERAYDHCTRIRNVLPQNKELRIQVATTTPEDWFPEYDSIMKDWEDADAHRVSDVDMMNSQLSSDGKGAGNDNTSNSDSDVVASYSDIEISDSESEDDGSAYEPEG